MNPFWKIRIKKCYLPLLHSCVDGSKKFRENPWLVKPVESCRLTGILLLECDPMPPNTSPFHWSEAMKLPNAQTCRKPNPLHLYQVIYSLVFIPSRSRQDHLERNPFSRPFPGFIVLMKIPTAPQISNPIKSVKSLSSLNITLLRFCLGRAKVILFAIFFSIFKPIFDIKIGKYK